MDHPTTAVGDEDAGPGAELPPWAIWSAGVFAFSATLISLVAIWMQLKNYRKPLLQRFVVRILWMVPIFAISSWISLVSHDIAFYVDAFRDIYEAFVIYCFFSLLVCYLGGERALLVMLHGRPYTRHLWPVSMWSKEVDVGDPYTFLFIKRGILQYVYVKPVLAAVTMLLKSNGAYNDGSISLTSGYFWVSFVYNLSVCLSLYCLGMFFMATQDDLEEFRPIPKFLCVKAVIFFSFWQGFAISVLISMGVMSNTTPDTAVAIQDFLICFEMVFASVGHWYAFSHKDYTELDILSARMPIYYAVRDASGIKDIIQDSLETLKGTRFNYRTFEPSEGVATQGMSRSGRIMAGLRYTGGGTAKYWLPDTNKIGIGRTTSDFFVSPPSPTSTTAASASASAATATINIPGEQPHYLNRPEPPRNPNSYSQQVLASSYDDYAPSLYFRDVDEQDEDGMEELYDQSKQLKFGDYNFPAIDVIDPKRSKESDRRKMERKNRNKSKKAARREEFGERTSLLGADETRPLMTESGSTAFGKSGWSKSFVPVAATTAATSETATASATTPATATTESTKALTVQAGTGRSKELRSGGKTTAPRDGCVDNVNGYVPEGKTKKKKGPSYPSSSFSSPPTTTTTTTNRPSSAAVWSGQSHQNSNPYNTSENSDGYDTYGYGYGYGYQSYQQPDSSAHYLGHQYYPQQQQRGASDDDEERRGPMFFFL